MSENLRDEMQRALKQTWRDRAMSVSFDVTWRAMTDAAWAVVGPELDRLRAEVERRARGERFSQQREGAESLREQIARAMHAWDVDDSPCDGPWENLTDDQRGMWRSGADAVLAVVRAEAEVVRNTWFRRAVQAQAERNDLRARLAKVERALMQGGQTDRIRWRAAVEALASVPEPSDSEPAPDDDRADGAS